MLTYTPITQDIENQVLVSIAGGGVAMVETAAGVLKAIEQRYGRIITNMCGGSAGGLVSALHMSWGQDSSKMVDLINNTSIDDWFELCPWQAFKSVFNLSNYVMDNTKLFEFLKKELTLDAYDKVQVSLTEYKDGGKIGRSFMAQATPATTCGTMAIQNIFPPVDIGDGVTVGDGGVKNLMPIPKVIDLPRYKHIFFIMAPESEMTNYNFHWKFLGKLISLLNGALEREMSQISELRLEELPNVTVIRPDKYAATSGLLNWSKDHEQVTEAYDFTMKQLETEKDII